MDQLTKNKIISVASELLKKAGFNAEVKLIEHETGEANYATLAIESADNLSMLIGKNGQNLNALEHLIRILVFKNLAGDEVTNVNEGTKALPNFVVDINDYRKLKTDYVVSMAKNAAQRVIQTKRAEALAPMSSYERRLVHMELALYKELQTESIGQEPRRRIVIKPQTGTI